MGSDISQPRLKTSLRVAAHIRRAQAGGAFATISRHGDDDAGAVFVKVFLGRGADGQPTAIVHYEGTLDDGSRGWRTALGGIAPEAEIDQWLKREADLDTDLWVLEIEDTEGRAFLLD